MSIPETQSGQVSETGKKIDQQKRMTDYHRETKNNDNQEISTPFEKINDKVINGKLKYYTVLMGTLSEKLGVKRVDSLPLCQWCDRITS